MPLYCCVGSCSNSSAKGFSLFRLPVDEAFLEKWKTAIGRKDFTVHHRICEAHFRVDDLEVAGGRKSVRQGVVPSLFCTCRIAVNSREDTKENEGDNTDHCYSKKTLTSHVNRKPLGLRQEHNYSSPSAAAMSPAVEKVRKSEGKSKRLSHQQNCALTRLPIGIQSLVPPEPPLEAPPEGPEVHPLKVENVQLKRKICELEKTLKQETSKKKNCNSTPKWMINLERRLSDQAVKEKEQEVEVNALGKHFSQDQARAMVTGNSRGVKWSDEAIMKGVSLRFSCGSTGYKEVSSGVAPQPSIRTLQRRVQGVEFEPGVLHNVLGLLKQEVISMSEHDRFCNLLFDEMSIEERIDFDVSTQGYIGYCTLNGQDTKRASKALVFQLHGIHSSWKQVVGYHFVTATAQPKEVKDVILDILKECESIGLRVLAVVCDMGNRNILNQLGFSCKKDDIVHTIQHSFSEDHKLYCIPDPVHVFKSAKEMILQNKVLQLTVDIVTVNCLQSNIVESAHIEWLEEFESDNLLKYSPKLNKKDLNPSHFQKMKVSTSTNVINHLTGSVLINLAKKGMGPVGIDTTGWFIEVFSLWFKVVTSRTSMRALSYKNQHAYRRAINILKIVRDMFKGMLVGVGNWKPVQTHIVMICNAFLDIQEELLQNAGFEFVCLGRFSQDSLENLFSSIRIQRPKPSALEFKFRLKQYCIAMHHHHVPESSYSHAESHNLLNGLKVEQAPKNAQQIEPSSCAVPMISDSEKEVLYRMSGYIVFKLKGNFKCASCYSSLLDQSIDVIPFSNFVAETDFYEGAQVRVNESVFLLFLEAEKCLRGALVNAQILGAGVNEKLLLMCKSSVKHVLLPTCHDVKDILLARYFSMRVKQFGSVLSKKGKGKPSGSGFASKSVGSRILADDFRPKHKISG